MSDLVKLDAIEERILGVLLEKEKTVPDSYPMTVNGILTACNQKSARSPVMALDDDMLQIGIDGLRGKGLVNTVVGGGSRTLKYKHNAPANLDIDPNEESIICLLLLRGPLTPGEVKSNGGRLYDFPNLESVQNCMHELAEREIPLIQLLPRRTGQKEGRYAHCLGGEIDLEALIEEESVAIAPVSNYEKRLSELELEVADLKEKMSRLVDLLD
ncbi:MAG: YceH family protein [Crocinitomicaceae bacterium]|nr:YceH family protein [Flavobacteriales bacterium]NQZ35983.1 YceH family protein [Crocinitomicaceae bacterium]